MIDIILLICREFYMNIHDLQLHFSIRKLSVGVVSCLIGICFISSNQTVQADSMPIASNNKSVIISNSSSNSNPTETKSSNKQDIVDSNNTSPTQIDSHSNQNSRSNSNPTETIASKSNNKQNIVDSNNTSQTQINSHSNQNSTKMVLVNSKLNISSQQPAAADSAENKLKTAALNPTIDEKLDAKMLAESKTTAQAKNTNGGFDASWGKLNVNNWKGSVQGDYYQLTDYTGDANHVIVPNEADFAKAGISTSGKQVGVTSTLMHNIFKEDKATTNDAFALDSKNGLHEYTNVNDNGGYDTDFWGKINVDDWKYTVNSDTIEINGLKDSASIGANDAVIVPNLDDFKLAGKDGGAKAVYISKNTLSKTARHKYYGLSKTNGSKFVTDSDLNNAFNNSNLTHADLNSLNTSNVTNMSSMFNGARSLTDLDVSNWDTGNVTNMSSMFDGASRLASLDVSNWDTGNVTDMSSMFNGASSLTDLDVSNWKTGNVTNMSNMFNGASRLASLDVSNWDTGNVTNMSWMFNGASRLALIANSGKFADYLVKNNFAYSGINSDVKSVTTDNTKLLKLLTNDIVKSESATRTIVFTFPANYSPDLAKYHLTKVNNIYQIKQSADYDNSYVQGTVLINATGKHRIDTTKPYKLSDTWQPNYDKLVLAHKNADGTVSFDNVQLPKVPGYKAKVNRNNGLLMVSYLVFAPEKPETNNNLNELQFSNKLATNSTVQFNSAVKSNIIVKSDMYQVVNDDHNWQLPVIKSYDLKFATNKNQIIFAYTKDKQYNYRFVLTFKDGQYRLTTFDKQGKLLKTYSIKSYKKLAKIIHSLVSMNIA
jgi:surface protein